jgi:hypothetical protein
LHDWTFPMSFLDFETIGPAIPRYNGQRPYQQLPFQFSCHFRKGLGAELEHCEYLHMTDTDPREAISRALIELVPKIGSVVAYNMGFESGVLNSLAESFPKFKKGLLRMSMTRIFEGVSVLKLWHRRFWERLRATKEWRSEVEPKRSQSTLR